MVEYVHGLCDSCIGLLFHVLRHLGVLSHAQNRDAINPWEIQGFSSVLWTHPTSLLRLLGPGNFGRSPLLLAELESLQRKLGLSNRVLPIGDTRGCFGCHGYDKTRGPQVYGGNERQNGAKTECSPREYLVSSPLEHVEPRIPEIWAYAESRILPGFREHVVARTIPYIGAYIIHGE